MDVDLGYDGDPTPEQLMDIDAEEVRLEQTLGSPSQREHSSSLQRKTHQFQYAERRPAGKGYLASAAATEAPEAMLYVGVGYIQGVLGARVPDCCVWGMNVAWTAIWILYFERRNV